MVLILLSVFPTMPACFYMLAAQSHLTSYQLALQVPQLAFLLASTVFGARAVCFLLLETHPGYWELKALVDV